MHFRGKPKKAGEHLDESGMSGMLLGNVPLNFDQRRVSGHRQKNIALLNFISPQRDGILCDITGASVEDAVRNIRPSE